MPKSSPFPKLSLFIDDVDFIDSTILIHTCFTEPNQWGGNIKVQLSLCSGVAQPIHRRPLSTPFPDIICL